MRNPLSDLPLNVKLLSISAALVIGLAVALLVQLPRTMEAQSEEWLVSRSVGVGSLLGHALEAAVDFDDAAAAAAVLIHLRDSRGTVYAVLRRPDGSLLGAWPGEGAEPPEPSWAAETTLLSDGLLRARFPIATRPGKSAVLFMGFEITDLEARRRDTRRSVLGIATIFLAFGLAGAFLLAQVLSRPIQRITEVARRVTDGQEHEVSALPIDRRDELGVLAVTIRQMLDRLSLQREQIRAINEDLAHRVQERTEQLSRTNEALAELERTQQQLVMADRRVSIGRLAAGVAHEINNPLAFLSGNLDFMADQLPAIQAGLEGREELHIEKQLLSRFADAVADTRQGAQRVASIVRGLKTFARDDEDRRELVRLESPLEAAIEMAMHEIKHRARLVRCMEPVPLIMGNEVRLSQVFLNLLVNAAHAIPEGASEKNEIRVTLRKADALRAVVEVADTGRGISPSEGRRIFDPFFTTKPVGVGTGLGLSISRNIVEKLGGEIGFESAVGKGSVFRVFLPLARPDHVDEIAGLQPPARPSLPHEFTLLVVDDEPKVGAAIERALEPEIRVEVATGGQVALQRILAGERFDRILCDLMMPDLSGSDLMVEVCRRAPQLREAFIFMTGGAFTDGARTFLANYQGPFLEKPLDLHQLRKILHGGPAA